MKKYSPIGEMTTFAKEYAQALYKATGHLILICDKDSVIAASGTGKKDVLQKHISRDTEKCLNERNILVSNKGDGNYVQILEDNDILNEYKYFLICPVISEGDVLGGVIILSADQKMTSTEEKLAQTACTFIGKQMEQ